MVFHGHKHIAFPFGSSELYILYIFSHCRLVPVSRTNQFDRMKNSIKKLSICRYKGFYEYSRSKGIDVEPVSLDVVVDGTVPTGTDHGSVFIKQIERMQLVTDRILAEYWIELKRLLLKF